MQAGADFSPADASSTLPTRQLGAPGIEVGPSPQPRRPAPPHDDSRVAAGVALAGVAHEPNDAGESGQDPAELSRRPRLEAG